MKSKSPLQTNRHGDSFSMLLLFGVIVTQFWFYVGVRGSLKDPSRDWQTVLLTIGYRDYGLIRRGLMGELAMRLAELLKTEYTYQFIGWFQLVSVLLFTAVVLGGLFYFFKKTDPADKSTTLLLSLAFVCSGCVSFYFYDWAALDVYMLGLTLVSAVCAIEGRLLFLIPINCALCTMIHEGYPMMFFFIIMAMLFYKWKSAAQPTVNKYFITMLASGLITGALFIYFYFLSSCKEGVTATDMYQKTQELTGIPQYQNIAYLFFHEGSPMGGFWVDGKPTEFFFKNVINIVIVFVLYLPVLWPLWAAQIRTIRKAAGSDDYFRHLVCFGGFLLVVPLFIIHTDAGRWLRAFFWYEFLINVFLLIMKDEAYTEELKRTLQNKKGFVLLLLLYYILNFDTNKWWMYNLSNNLAQTILLLLNHK